jgi:hypothetical protein
MSAPAQPTDDAGVPGSTSAAFPIAMTRMPTVDRIVKRLLYQDPPSAITPGEDVVMDVTILNLKHWYDSF